MSAFGALVLVLVLDDEACRSAGVGRAQLFVEPVGMHTHHRLPVELRGQPYQLEHDVPTSDDELALIAVTEQVTNPESRVVLSDELDRYGVPRPRVQWEVMEVDRRTVDFAVSKARDLLFALGATDARRRSDAWSVDAVGGPHHLGTTRMAHSPADGVIDSDCRVHGVDNPYIAGGSAFPTGGYAPPTLTVVALGLRLADHLSPSP